MGGRAKQDKRGGQNPGAHAPSASQSTQPASLHTAPSLLLPLSPSGTEASRHQGHVLISASSSSPPPPVQNDIPAARQDFLRATQLRNNKRRNIVGHLALAAVMYNQKQYKEALQT